MKKWKLILFGILSLFVLLLIWKNFSSVEKYFFKLYLSFPSGKTIYEKNNNPNYAKTVIEIPSSDKYIVAVFKDQHKLKLIKNSEIIKEYGVNIKREFEDRKVWEDNQTPEGIFSIETMDVVSRPAWERWMRLDTLEKSRKMYIENYQDGEARLLKFEKEQGKIISDKDIRKFNQKNPKQKLLRGIGIHGGGFSLYHDWTDGCIGMSDEDVIELFDFLKENPNGGIGTVVIIQD